MPHKELGNKCLVDTVKVFADLPDVESPTIKVMEERELTTARIFVEMDGQHWDSSEYETMEEFLQSIINHAHQVSMGKE